MPNNLSETSNVNTEDPKMRYLSHGCFYQKIKIKKSYGCCIWTMMLVGRSWHAVMWTKGLIKRWAIKINGRSTPSAFLSADDKTRSASSSSSKSPLFYIRKKFCLYAENAGPSNVKLLL